MKTSRKGKSSGGMFSKRERMKQTANLAEYESNVLDQTLSRFNTFRNNSVILASVFLTSNHKLRLLVKLRINITKSCVFRSC